MTMENKDKITENAVPGDAIIESVLKRLYLPDTGPEPEEVLSHTDVLNSVRAICAGCDSETLYSIMEKLGFPSRTIEGVIYWFVKTP